MSALDIILSISFWSLACGAYFFLNVVIWCAIGGKESWEFWFGKNFAGNLPRQSTNDVKTPT